MQFLRISPADPLQLLQTGQKTLRSVFKGPPREATSANLRFTRLFTWSGGPNARQMLELPGGPGCDAWLGVVGPGGPVLGPAVLPGAALGPQQAAQGLIF